MHQVGGAESYMFSLSRALVEEGFDVAYWGMEHADMLVEDKYGTFAEEIDYGSMGLLKKFSKSFATVYSGKNRSKMAKILDRFRPDIVHLHNYNFQLTASILPEMHKRGIKVVQTIHDSQMVCPYHRLYNFQRDATCTKCVEGSFVNCIKDRCFNDSYFQSTLGALESTLYHGLNYYNRYLDAIISPSQFLADLVSRRVDVPIRVIPNFYQLPSDFILSPSNNRDYYLYYGRVSPEKGIVEFQEMANKLKFKLLVVGKGESVDRIKNTAYVTYLGPKYGNELLTLIAGAKAVVQPAKWYENCPMTVIESYAVGTPVICSDHSGFKELVDPEKTGYLLNFDSPDAHQNWKAMDDELTNRSFFTACRERFNQHYSKQCHMRDVTQLYQTTYGK